MARGTLHAPKPDDLRRRRNAPTHAETVVTRDGVLRGPSLEEATGRPDSSWSPQVVLWWKTWRLSPQAQVFEATDWSRLATLAPLVESYHRRPSAAALSEIRMNEERLGATITDRLRARIRIQDDGTQTLAPVESLEDRRESARKRLLGEA